MDCGINEALISQRFVKKNGFKITPSARIRIVVDGYQITIYRSHDLVIQAKDSYNVAQRTKRTLYATDIDHYDLILGMSWLDHVNLDIHWSKREWFYRRNQAAIKKLDEKEFAKSLDKEIIVYAFYRIPTESQSDLRFLYSK